MQRMRPWLLAAAVFAVLAVALISLRDQRFEQTLVVGVDPTFPPFVSQQADGQLVGFEIDLAKALARRLHCHIEFREIPFPDLLTSLQDGLVNLVISGMPVRQDRAVLADFTEPYYDATQVAVISATDRRCVECPEDLAGWRMAVQVGTTGEFEALAIKGTDLDPKLLRMERVAEMFTALESGEVEVVLVDRQLAERYIAGNPSFRMVRLTFWEEKYAVAVQKEQAELLELVNNALTRWLSSPAYEEALNCWFSLGE